MTETQRGRNQRCQTEGTVVHVPRLHVNKKSKDVVCLRLGGGYLQTG